MRIALWIVFLVTAAFGGVVWFTPEPQDRALAEVADVGAGGIARVGVQAPPQAAPPSVAAEEQPADRFFGFALPGQTAATARPETAREKPIATAQVPLAQVPVAKAAARTPPAPTGAWTTSTVLTPEGGSRPAAVVVASLPARGMPSVRDIPRDAMVRDLQRELKRVGCYTGGLDGEWGSSSKRALQAFLEKANSALPVVDPDLFQLTLVRGFQGAACSAHDGTTVAGSTATGLTGTGRPVAVRSETAKAGVPAPHPVAVRALPQTSAQIAAARPPAGSPQSSAQGLAIVAIPVVAVPVQSAVVQPPVPFEGRMAIGAPLAAELPDGAAARPLTAEGSEVPPPVLLQSTRPRPAQPRAASQVSRGERSWTRNFFNQ